MSARRHRGTPSIVLSALLGVVACRAARARAPDAGRGRRELARRRVRRRHRCHRRRRRDERGCRHTRQLRARRAGERLGSAEERGSHRRADPDRGGRGVPDRRLPVRGLPDMLGDELLELPPRTERAARVPRGRSARRVRRRTSPRPAVSRAGSTRARRPRRIRPAPDRSSRRPCRRRHRRRPHHPRRRRRRHLPGEARSRRGAIGRAGPVRAGSDRHDRRCADDRRGRTGRRHDDQPAEHRDRRRGRFDDDRTRIIRFRRPRTGARSVASTSAARRTRRVASRSRWSPGSRSSSRSRRARASSAFRRRELDMTTARLPRPLHPGAWWLWALGLATAASRTTNPLLLGLILAVVAYVVACRAYRCAVGAWVQDLRVHGAVRDRAPRRVPHAAQRAVRIARAVHTARDRVAGSGRRHPHRGPGQSRRHPRRAVRRAPARHAAHLRRCGERARQPEATPEARAGRAARVRGRGDGRAHVRAATRRERAARAPRPPAARRHAPAPSRRA